MVSLETTINENETLIEFPIGDWSADGHGKCDYYLAKTDKNIDDVREAHFKVNESYGFDIGDICSEMDDRELDPKVTSTLEKLGYDFDKIDDKEWMSSDEVFDVWIYLLNSVDPDLELKKFKTESIHLYGNDKKGRHLSTPGYGIYE